ncbi:MAG: 2'-5' RNA ligase family protein [Trueperaceae bacterium]
MGLAVELYFDARTEDTITALRDAVHDAGIEASPRLTGSRPHISLALVKTEDVPLLGGVVTEFARESGSCHLRLGALSSFASEQGVLYLAPVPTIGLLEIHSRLHEHLKSRGLESDPLYRPGAWVPHCTIEMGLSGSQLAAAFDACWVDFTPIDGRLVAAGVVSYPPPRCHFVTPLQGA